MSQPKDSAVTIKVDSRMFYGLVAALAVVGVFGVGWYLASTLSQGNVATAPANAPASSAPAADTAGGQPAAGAAVDGSGAVVPPAEGAGAVVPGGPPAGADSSANAGKGAPPLSPDEVAVADGQARLWVEELADGTTFSLGAIPADKKTEKDFTITNKGKGQLVIDQASASCGCTAAVVDKSNLAPGESTKLRVTYDPRTNSEFGKFVQKQIRIKSNDPVVPLVEFTVTADVAAQ